MSQLHSQAALAQSSSPYTHRIEGLLDSRGGMENLRVIKKKSLPIYGIEIILLVQPVPSHFTDYLTMVK